MRKSHIKFDNVTFVYDSASEPLLQNISFHAACGWSGVVGANGTGKTTLLKLASGLLEPVEGHIERPGNALYCPQRTDHIPEKLEELILSGGKSACMIKNKLGIQDDWVQRWLTLSHGERKRAQIAVALWLKPEVLAIDEPTNHVDAEGREIIGNALHSFDGVGLLVSHDRELLDSLCGQCLFIEPPNVVVRAGGVTKGMETAKAEEQFVRRQYAQKKRAYKRVKTEAVRRRELAKQSAKRRSKRGLARKDHDGRERKDRARVSGKDGVGGRLRRQMKGRVRQVHEQLENIRVKKECRLGIWLAGSVSKRNSLLDLRGGRLNLGGPKRLCYPELIITPTDRIAVTGPNGSGKSTLIRHMVKSIDLPKEHVTYIPQEIDLCESRRILSRARALSDDKLGHLMTIVSRLGSRPHRLLESGRPSPGETRKLLLATGMTHAPHIVIMDEPTNHMDLSSVECLEEALSDCPCCLILVSHDKHFLGKLTQIEWRISRESGIGERFVLHVMQ
ncbi:MAG: ATP-binding cassette domain-containing protein [Planctomycetota bacterium]|jgi:ATPase subunit of ABC transporter with duplicated ATPase domains